MKTIQQIFEDYKIALGEDGEGSIDLNKVIYDILEYLYEKDKTQAKRQ